MSGPVSLPILQMGLPDPIYWVPSLLLLVGLFGIIYIIRPPVTDWTGGAFAPWIALGAVLHVMRLQPIVPDPLVPLFGTPTVYLTTATATLATWSISQLVTDMRPPGASNDRQMAVVGITLLVLLTIASLFSGTTTPGAQIRPLWPGLGLFFASVGSGLVWVAISILFTDSAASTGRTGALVVFAHVLEGASVLVGHDILGRIDSPAPLTSAILQIGDAVPVVGGGGVYVLVKVVLAAVVVVAFKRIVDESPRAGRLGLTVVAAAGLAPAVQNLLLFTVVESTELFAVLVPVV